MTKLKVALLHRPGKAITGVSSYARLLKKALEEFVELKFFDQAPKDGFDIIHILDTKKAKAEDFEEQKVPVLLDLHDYYWAEYQFFPSPDAPIRWLMQKLRKRHYLRMIELSDGVIVHSQAVASYVLNKRVFLVRIGIDFTDFLNLPETPREPLILLVGRDAFRKGLGSLLSAIRKIKKDFPDLKAEVIGREYLHSRILGKVLSLGLDLQFRGELLPEDLKKKYQGAMMVYLGSFQEGLGLSLLEGMAGGAVAIGSKAGGIPEILEQGKSGLLFTPGDSLELASKLSSILSSEELRKKLAKEGAERVKKLFSLERMRKDLLGAYEGIFKK